MSTELLGSVLSDPATWQLNAKDEFHIISLLRSAIDATSELSINAKAERFVSDLGDYQSQAEDLDSIAWYTWEAIVFAASRIRYNHYGQDLLVMIIETLNTTDGPWKGLPSFAISMRDNWNHSPTFDLEYPNSKAFTLDQWLNLNSFAARLLKSSAAGPLGLALWQLREGLEEEEIADDTKTHIFDTRVRVASEWILQGSKRLLKECLLSSFSTAPVDDTHGNPYRGGPLYSGHRGFTSERWGFWKRRMSEITGNSVSTTTAASLKEAIDVMSYMELEVAKTI